MFKKKKKWVGTSWPSCRKKKKVEVCLSWSGAPPFWPRGVGAPGTTERQGPGAGDPRRCSAPTASLRRVAMSSPVSTPPPAHHGEYRDCPGSPPDPGRTVAHPARGSEPGSRRPGALAGWMSPSPKRPPAPRWRAVSLCGTWEGSGTRGRKGEAEPSVTRHPPTPPPRQVAVVRSSSHQGTPGQLRENSKNLQQFFLAQWPWDRHRLCGSALSDSWGL